jgi:hypothetical protein
MQTNAPSTSNGARTLALRPAPTRETAATRETTPTRQTTAIRETAPISESTARLLGATAVLGVGLIHILDAAGTYQSTRWIFWAYMVLIVASVPVALLLLHSASPAVWTLAAGVAAGPFFAYLWSRSIGLPGDAADIGNWVCTLGMAALFVESSLLGLSATRLGVWLRARAEASQAMG